MHEFEVHFKALKNEHAQTDAQLKVVCISCAISERKGITSNNYADLFQAQEKQHDLEIQLEACRRDLSNEHEKSTSIFEERQYLGQVSHLHWL